MQNCLSTYLADLDIAGRGTHIAVGSGGNPDIAARGLDHRAGIHIRNTDIARCGPGLQTICPAGHDSEALLALPQLSQIAGQRIVIFRGVGGRELLADTLKTRAAHVEYAECYRRVRPHTDSTPLVQRWATSGIDAVTITSAETLHNLVSMLGDAGAAHLRTTPVFAPHEKIAAAARELGIAQVIATAGGDAGLLSGLITWFQTHT